MERDEGPRADDLIARLRAAGEVPPPPDRDRALRRALAAVRPRSRLRRPTIAFVAAVLASVPVGVLATRGRVPQPAPEVEVVPTETPAEEPREDREDEATLHRDPEEEEDRSGSDPGPDGDTEETEDPEDPEGDDDASEDDTEAEEGDTEEPDDEEEADEDRSGSNSGSDGGEEDDEEDD